MTRAPTLASLALAVAIAALPARSEAAGEGCFAATSLASTINDPTNGDEQFFTLPIGPANLMLLLDTSGSMLTLPQCGDNIGRFNWGDTGFPMCVWPFNSTVANPGTVGTCDVRGNAALSWMHDYTPTADWPDPGHATNGYGLTDVPDWGPGCTGNACLFREDAFYAFNDWTETSATQREKCTVYDSSGNPVRDWQGNVVRADQATCDACLDSGKPGFFFFKVRYRSGGTNASPVYTTSARQLRFRGGWLNANPPKFLSAKKVIKDTVWMDPDNKSGLDQVRFGLSILYNTRSTNAARIVVPLGPDKSDSYPANPAAVVQVRQYIIDALNKDRATSTSFVSGGTPIASALFNLGQYFASPAIYTAFGSRCGSSGRSTCSQPDYAPTQDGLVDAPWATNNADQCTVCWGCQDNAVIVVTDGSPNNEQVLPPAVSTFADATFKSPANCGTNGSLCVQPVDGAVSLTPRVAAWLANTDLRDPQFQGKQAVKTHTISFGLRSLVPGDANSIVQNILRATANMGEGTWNNASDGRGLAEALAKAVSAVVERANSFSAPSASSLSTIHTAASEAFLTRFVPNDTPAWEGHVFQGILFDEFLNGCDPTKTPTGQPLTQCAAKAVYPNFNGNADAEGYNICTDVFLVDRDCDEVVEDGKSGAFIKKGTGNVPADLVWDAGEVLSNPAKPGYRTARTGVANSRHIWTQVNGAKVMFEPANAATLRPRLNVNATYCADLYLKAQLCGGSGLPACRAVWGPADLDDCAKQVINYVRGWDVMDADGDDCGGPGNPTNGSKCPGGADGEERDRVNDASATDPVFWKLGDVFHSSPVLVKPPATEAVCDTGYENQCVPTLRSPPYFPSQTPIVQTYTACQPDANAYEKFRYDRRTRQRLLLVGANDGMLHAFDAGRALTAQPPDRECNHPFSNGTGEEMWAFIPPDLLPRLKDSLFKHLYLVDGSTMVRDIWKDLNSDGRKQDGEFKTIAVVTERAGGTQFTALDVTDPTAPAFLWTFPPPDSPYQKWMGQSWSDFAPRPPPIGPVRLETLAGEPDPTGRGFSERWIVMLNGGYDPAMVLGRAVWMVDAWTGAVVWKFTDEDFKAQYGFGSGTSMFPVAAAVGLTDVGDLARPKFDNDGFFDTATWGDLGGQIFLARFHVPGKRNPVTGLVTNWFAARTFEQRRRPDDLQAAAGRTEFFYMTEHAYEPVMKALHVYSGSGNREQIMQEGEVCGPDRLLSCCRAGCSSVSSVSTDTFGACTSQGTFTCPGGMLQFSRADTCVTDPLACGASTSGATVELDFTCAAGAGSTTAGASGSFRCDASGACDPVVSVGSETVGGPFAACTRSRFYGVLAYGAYPEKTFVTAAEAKSFDQGRYTDVPFSGEMCKNAPGKSCALVDTSRAITPTSAPTAVCPAGVTKCAATNADPGWFYEYGVKCPTANCPDFGTCSPEKSGSAPLVTFGCVLWNSFQPIGVQTGTDPCTGSVGTPLTYGYVSDYVSGVPSGTCAYPSNDGNLYRGQERSSVSPPAAPILRVTASSKGIRYSGLQLDPGAPPVAKTAGTRSEFAEPIYWLEVTRQMHKCRHDEATAASTCE